MNRDIAVVDHTRNLTADILKGFLITCVLFGHSLSMVNQIRGVAWTDSWINVFLTSFEMQLFSIISGYFMAKTLKKHGTLRASLSKVRLIFPIFFLVDLPTAIIAIIQRNFSVIGGIPGLFVEGDKLWYLSAYILNFLLLCLVDKIVEKRGRCNRYLLCGVLFLTIAVVSHILPTDRLNLAKCMSVYFSLGYFMEKCEVGPVFFRLHEKFRCGLLAMSAVAYFVVLFFYKAQYSFYLFGASIYGKDIVSAITIYLMRFFCAILGSFLIVTVFKLLSDHRVGLVYGTFLGRISLDVYIISMFVQEALFYLFKLVFTDHGALLNDWSVTVSVGPLFFIMLITATVVLSKLINKIPLLAFCLLGKPYKRNDRRNSSEGKTM